MSLCIRCQPHPLLYAVAFVTEHRQALGAQAAPTELTGLLDLAHPAPVAATEQLRTEVRALLRHGGFKPSGRSKPASEYLIRAVEQGALGSINLAVDACNVASLHSGLPISVVDLDKAQAPFSISIVAQGESYVFNATGQVLDLGGLLCLHDAIGPCANAVKDCQRTKTDASTTRTLSVVWGVRSQASHVDATAAWYRSLLADHGARTSDAAVLYTDTQPAAAP
jgi:DNA/RNA-binding domain of Phe-tRNA-synthetase-like protein